MVARILQGVGTAFISIATPAILIIEYPAKKEVYVGYSDMAIGLGHCLGPVIGSLLY